MRARGATPLLQDDDMRKSEELTQEQAEHDFRAMFKDWPPVGPPSLRSRRKNWLRPAVHKGRAVVQEAA